MVPDLPVSVADGISGNLLMGLPARFFGGISCLDNEAKDEEDEDVGRQLLCEMVKRGWKSARISLPLKNGSDYVKSGQPIIAHHHPSHRTRLAQLD